MLANQVHGDPLLQFPSPYDLLALRTHKKEMFNFQFM